MVARCNQSQRLTFGISLPSRRLPEGGLECSVLHNNRNLTHPHRGIRPPANEIERVVSEGLRIPNRLRCRKLQRPLPSPQSGLEYVRPRSMTMP